MIAGFINEYYGDRVTYIADVAGGQGMLSRTLNKRYNYHSEVIDPRSNVLKGVPNRAEVYSPALATYYDLIVGLHADEATRAVAESALLKPAILVPCCNFWSEQKLGQFELLDAIERFYTENGVVYERIELGFRGPKNIAVVSAPL